MKRLAAVVAVVGAVAYVTVLQPDAPMPPTPANPYRYCVESAKPDHRWDCYLLGDVPNGATVVWAGLQSDIPR